MVLFASSNKFKKIQEEDPQQLNLSSVKEQPTYLVERYNSIQYTFDGVGNRLSLTKDNHETIHYTYNEANQLLQAGDTSYAYDDNGNQIAKFSPEGTVEHSYNGLNRLIEVAFEDSSYAKYEYDALGRKVSREELTFQNWNPKDTEEGKSNNGLAHGINGTNNGNGQGKLEHANQGNGNANAQADGQGNGSNNGNNGQGNGQGWKCQRTSE